jgi:cell division septation protein DedD
VGREETDEERLDRLEKEEEERDAMVELEAKTVDAKREMAVADALDEIRTRNARVERADRDGLEATVASVVDQSAELQEREDAEAARRAFNSAKLLGDMIAEEIIDDGEISSTSSSTLPSVTNSIPSESTTVPFTSSGTKSSISTDMPPPSFKRVVKKKKDHAALLGIKKKPSLV